MTQLEAKKRLEAHKDLKLHLGGLQDDMTENDLYEYFSEFGEIRNVYIIYDFDTKKSRGFGFIEFKKRKEADRCLNSDHMVNGVVVIVSKMKLKNDIKKEREKKDDILPTQVEGMNLPPALETAGSVQKSKQSKSKKSKKSKSKSKKTRKKKKKKKDQ